MLQFIFEASRVLLSTIIAHVLVLAFCAAGAVGGVLLTAHPAGAAFGVPAYFVGLKIAVAIARRIEP